MTGLIDTIRGALDSNTVAALAGQLGESPQNTGNALNGIIPVILTAMAGRIGGGGASSVVNLIQSALAGGNPLDRLGALAGASAPGVAPNDGGLVSGLLGSSVGGIAATLGERFGIKADSVRALLGMGSLLSAGGVTKALGGNVTSQGLTDLFHREGPAIQAAVPSGISGLLGSLGGAAAGAGAAATAATQSASGGWGRWWPWLLLGLAALALIFALRSCNTGAGTTAAVPSATDPAPATVATPAPVPTGAGVVAETREGRPTLIVYFDTAKSAVHNDLATASAALKTYMEENPTTTLAVSGFNDPTGNAAANAELSKNRAQAVKAALEKTGISGDRIVLEKPAESTQIDASLANARRVEVTIKQ